MTTFLKPSATDYMMNESTKLAQYILLGKGGAKLLDELNLEREVYHLNRTARFTSSILFVEKIRWRFRKVKERFFHYVIIQEK